MTTGPSTSRLGPLADRLRLPLVAAPMTAVSGPELVAAACASGAIGSFPTANCASPAQLDEWLDEIDQRIETAGRWRAPVAPNLIVHRTNARLEADLAVLVARRVELVICSVGSPAAVIGPLHEAGAAVWADVASMRHLDRAAQVGADGLVLLTAGAGGQTGWANPLAFARAARRSFEGPLALAGGICDGTALRAALTLGCDVGYAGTCFIATTEGQADAAWRDLVVGASLDDIVLTDSVTGIPASILRASLDLDGGRSGGEDAEGFDGRRLHRRSSARSAGHSVIGVDRVLTVAELVDRFAREYRRAGG
jgi:nitronate monooxygenase